jgi:hypothetical protein
MNYDSFHTGVRFAGTEVPERLRSCNLLPLRDARASANTTATREAITGPVDFPPNRKRAAPHHHATEEHRVSMPVAAARMLPAQWASRGVGCIS